MASRRPVFTRATFQFFKDLGCQNRKEWMDTNRDRYQAAIVQPFRRLLEELAPRALELDSRFDTSGRTGPNFSRINRDIRFAKDKTLYKTHMYLKFSVPAPSKRETGQLYVGLSADAVTVGFRIYSGGKRKESTLALIAEPRVNADSRWVAKQKKRLGRRYESYWYATVKGEWTKHPGWPIVPENWKKILAWIVRRKSGPSVATRASFPREAAKVFRDLYPLLRFTSLPE
ncbi:MAG: hypothetical protein DMG55_30625 [Acidobacteria bacterium]|nr:MAG: hypothetical protein DMG55_30625 [Acidobacteriota bacterium]